MRSRIAFLVLVLPCLLPLPARAQILVGPNLEASYWSFGSHEALYDATDLSGSVVGIGGNYLVPGLRLGYLCPGGRLEIVSDLGLQMEQVFDIGYTRILATPGLEYMVLADRNTTPYFGASVGVLHVSSDYGSHTSNAILGGAIGVRHRVASGHGALRAEFRVDHFFQDDHSDSFSPDNTFGIRFGADLLVTR